MRETPALPEKSAPRLRDTTGLNIAICSSDGYLYIVSVSWVSVWQSAADLHYIRYACSLDISIALP